MSCAATSALPEDDVAQLRHLLRAQALAGGLDGEADRFTVQKRHTVGKALGLHQVFDLALQRDVADDLRQVLCELLLLAVAQMRVLQRLLQAYPAPRRAFSCASRRACSKYSSPLAVPALTSCASRNSYPQRLQHGLRLGAGLLRQFVQNGPPSASAAVSCAGCNANGASVLAYSQFRVNGHAEAHHQREQRELSVCFLRLFIIVSSVFMILSCIGVTHTRLAGIPSTVDTSCVILSCTDALGAALAQDGNPLHGGLARALDERAVGGAVVVKQMFPLRFTLAGQLALRARSALAEALLQRLVLRIHRLLRPLQRPPSRALRPRRPPRAKAARGAPPDFPPGSPRCRSAPAAAPRARRCPAKASDRPISAMPAMPSSITAFFLPSSARSFSPHSVARFSFIRRSPRRSRTRS